MAAHPKVGVGYNAQVAVDAKHKLIAEQHVTNAGSDLGFLAETAGAAKDIFGVERIDVVADMGYYMGEDIAACERAGITPYVARPQRGTAVGDGRFPKERFRYYEAADCYHGPAEQRLDTRYRWLRAVMSSCNIRTRAPAAVADSRPSVRAKLPPHHAVGRRGCA
jgi:hypothetical protein